MDVRRETRNPGQRTLRYLSTFLHPSSFPVLWAARAVAVLFGAGLAVALVGYVRIVESILGPAPTMGLMVIGAAFVCGAAGPWVARRAALSLVDVWARTVRGAFPAGPGVPEVRDSSGDRAFSGLPWLLQSMLGVLLGVLLLAGLASSAGVRRAWTALSTDYFWTPPTEIVCLCVLIVAIVGPVGMTAGLQFTALYSAVSQSRAALRRGVGGEARVTASLLVGVAVGLLVNAVAGTPGLSAEQWVLLAAVPMFAISVLSVFIARRVEQDVWQTSGQQADPQGGRGGASGRQDSSRVDGDVGDGRGWTPEGEARGLILTSIAGWGIATGLWACALLSMCRASADGPLTGQAGWMAAAMAVGAWIAGWPQGRHRYSMGGFGLAVWAGGAAIMLAVASVSTGSGRGYPFPGLRPALWATAICLGHALSYGRRTFVPRSSGERLGLAQWAAAALCGLVTGIFAHYWFTTAAGSDVVAMTGACLLLLIFGGLLLIHERAAARHVRVRRIGLVFASLALAVMVLPSAARRAPARTGDPAWAGTFAAGATGHLWSDRHMHLGWAAALCRDFGWAGPGAQVASIGDVAFVPSRDGDVWRIDHVLWNPRDEAESQAYGGRRDASLSGPPVVHPSVDVWWRRGRSQYDLLLQTTDGLPAADVPARLSWEWFEGLRRRLLSGGTLLLELPLGRMDMAAAESAAQTFAAVFDGYGTWLVLAGTESDLAVYLLANGSSNPPSDAPTFTSRRLSSGGWVWLHHLPGSVNPAQRIPLNTLRTPAFQASHENREWGTAVLRWMLVTSSSTSLPSKE